MVTYFEYSDYLQQQVIVPWMSLSSIDEIRTFARQLKNSNHGFLRGDTSISGAMEFAMKLLESNSYHSYRSVLDLSGNGRNNDGPPLKETLPVLLSEGITINGLALPPGKDNREGPYKAMFSGYEDPIVKYFEEEVNGGPRFFVILIDNDRNYIDAILRKLVMEIAYSDQQTKYTR